jgi:hypothetical protein
MALFSFVSTKLLAWILISLTAVVLGIMAWMNHQNREWHKSVDRFHRGMRHDRVIPPKEYRPH